MIEVVEIVAPDAVPEDTSPGAKFRLTCAGLQIAYKVALEVGENVPEIAEPLGDVDHPARV